MSFLIDMSKWKTRRFTRGTRYYELSLLQNLWGEWEIQFTNGRIESRLGKIRYEPCNNYMHGQRELKKYCDYRTKTRHYHEENNYGKRH